MGMFNSAWFRLSTTPFRSGTAIRHPRVPREQPPIWVIHASETGVAEDFADATCRQLRRLGRSTRLLSLDAFDPKRLSEGQQALFLVSTTGDGEPPCIADAFAERCMRAPADLSRLDFGLLALGDRRYERFCAFGRQLHAWLLASGAHALFDALEMDDENPAISRQWYTTLAAHLGPRSDQPPEPIT